MNSARYLEEERRIIAKQSVKHDLQVPMIVVPPNELVLIEVVLTMTYSNSDGTVDIDFSKRDFEILCPLASVSVLS